MSRVNKDSVLAEIADYYGQRSRLLGDCEAEPEIAQDILRRLEELRDMAVKVELAPDYIKLLGEVIMDVAVIAEEEYCRRYYGGNPDVQKPRRRKPANSRRIR